jgi:hypothetical protein
MQVADSEDWLVNKHAERAAPQLEASQRGSVQAAASPDRADPGTNRRWQNRYQASRGHSGDEQTPDRAADGEHS